MSLTLAQRIERQNGLGASDAAPAMALSKWKSPLELYLEKTEDLSAANDDDSGSEFMYWGSKLESMIAEGWTEKTGIKVRRVNQTLRHPEHDFMLAHLDRRQVGNGRPLECKNVNVYYARSAFGEDGSDEVPEQYLIQVHHQISIARAIWGAEGAELAALIGGNELRSFSFNYDAELEELIVNRERQFWQHVTDRIPPPPVNLTDLEILYAEDNGAIKAVTDPEIVKRWELLHDLKTSLKAKEGAVKEQELKLKLVIAEAAGIKFTAPLDGPDDAGISYAGKTLATWKTQGKAGFDAKRFQGDHPKLFDQYKTGVRFRVLRLTKP